VIDDAIRERLVVMTTDFKRLWSDPSTPNRERKRMLAYVIEDATLVKLPREGTTKVHLRFKGGQTTTVPFAAPTIARPCTVVTTTATSVPVEWRNVLDIHRAGRRTEIVLEAIGLNYAEK
jgi:hypothetical protein